MRAVKIFLILILGSLLYMSCSAKLSEDEYYQKAKQEYGKNHYQQAIENFKKITEYYPNGKRAPESLFMLGFIYANDLKKYDLAKQYYTEFIKKYPKNELVDDAQYEIENLGKDPNELPIFKQIAGDSVKQK